ncbi:unnamed protein product, partial [marine sediment metagenome]
MIGVDGNRIFETYMDDVSNADIYIVGYTKSGVTFFTNAYDKSLEVSDEWTEIDCSTEAPSAIGLIWEVKQTGISANNDMGLRKNGSTDDRHSDVDRYNCFGAVIGCDASQICEGWIDWTGVD